MARRLILFAAVTMYCTALNAQSVTRLDAVAGVPDIDKTTQTQDVQFRDSRGDRMTVPVRLGGAGPYQFLVDTGASGIALSRRDAERLGFDDSKLNYDTPFSTANGMTRGARITLDALQVGPLTAHGVHAWVNEGDLDQSLLGMSYLSTLGRVEIKGDTLTLER